MGSPSSFTSQPSSTMPANPFSRKTTMRPCPAFGGPTFRDIDAKSAPFLSVAQPEIMTATIDNTTTRQIIAPPGCIVQQASEGTVGLQWLIANGCGIRDKAGEHVVELAKSRSTKRLGAGLSQTLSAPLSPFQGERNKCPELPDTIRGPHFCATPLRGGWDPAASRFGRGAPGEDGHADRHRAPR